MIYRTPDGKFRRPKEVIPPPSVNEIIKFAKYWKPKTMTYLGQKKYFDQDIRIGECYFCKKEGRAQKSAITYLHHVNYDHKDYLAWTIEVCASCHYHVDGYLREKIDNHFGRIKPRAGYFPYPKRDHTSVERRYF